LNIIDARKQRNELIKGLITFQGGIENAQKQEEMNRTSEKKPFTNYEIRIAKQMINLIET
jgi:hypothetical protein